VIRSLPQYRCRSGHHQFDDVGSTSSQSKHFNARQQPLLGTRPTTSKAHHDNVVVVESSRSMHFHTYKSRFETRLSTTWLLLKRHTHRTSFHSPTSTLRKMPQLRLDHTLENTRRVRPYAYRGILSSAFIVREAMAPHLNVLQDTEV
jgi:hypothetical protein